MQYRWCYISTTSVRPGHGRTTCYYKASIISFSNSKSIVFYQMHWFINSLIGMFPDNTALAIYPEQVELVIVCNTSNYKISRLRSDNIVRFIITFTTKHFGPHYLPLFIQASDV